LVTWPTRKIAVPLQPRGGDDRFDAGLGHHFEPVLRQIEAAGAHRHLLLGFLAGHVERRVMLGYGAERLQQDGRLADAWVATDQHDRAVHQAAAEHAVQLARCCGEARYFLDADFGQGPDVGLLACPASAARWWRSTFDEGFHQGIPGTAIAALAGPFRKGRAAFGAAIHALGLGHGKLRVW